MGRKARAKQWRRFVKAAEAYERETAKPPCASCAFTDPECWLADQAIGHKLLACLKGGTYFWCHHGMELGGAEGRAYQPPLRPDGLPDTAKMEPCGGFIRWAATVRALSPEARQMAVDQLQYRMLRRYLADDPLFGARLRAQGIDAGLLQRGIQLMLAQPRAEAETETTP